MSTVKRSYVVSCEAREGYLMTNGVFTQEIDMAKLFDNAANAKRSAWHYGATVLEIGLNP